jgi:hypothetical protein
MVENFSVIEVSESALSLSNGRAGRAGRAFSLTRSYLM